MKARRLFYYEHQQGETLVEMIVWMLPEQSAERPHGLKYRLYCGRAGKCVVRYDNETGKGDHRHCGVDETRYDFDSLEKLLEFQR